MKKERNVNGIICTICMILIVSVFMAGGAVYAYVYDQSAHWSQNLLTNPNPDSTSGWSKASSASTGDMIYESGEFQATKDGAIGTWYQDVMLSENDIVRAANGELQAYASANIWGAITSTHYGSVTLLFYNASGQVYNGNNGTWTSSQPSLSDHNTMYGASGTTKYSVTIGGTGGKYHTSKKWHAMYLGSSSNLSDFSYSSDETHAAHTSGVKVPAGTVKIRYCVSHHCNINWSSAKKFCLKLKDTTVPYVSGFRAETSDGKGLSEKHAAGTKIRYDICFAEAVSVKNSGTLSANVGTASYVGGVNNDGKTTLTYELTIPENGAVISDNHVVGLVSLTNLTVVDEAGNTNTITMDETALNNNTSFGTNGTIRMDNRPPELVSLTSEGISENSFLGINDTIVINANFHENVKISGTPVIVLSNGKTMTATQETSTDSNIVAFYYTVTSDEDVNHLEIQSIDLSGIIDMVGQKSTDSLKYEEFCTKNEDYLDTYNISIDTTAPIVTYPVIEESYLNQNTKVTITITDNVKEDVTGSGVYEVWSAWTAGDVSTQPSFPTASNVQAEGADSYVVTNPKTEGIWKLWILAKDETGNSSVFASEQTYAFDIAAPSITIVKEDIEGFAVTKKVTATVTDSVSGVVEQKYRWENAANEVVGSGFVPENGEIFLPEEHGLYTLIIEAKDNVGNESTEREEQIFVDKIAPSIAISGELDGYAQKMTLNIVCTEEQTTIQKKEYCWMTTAIADDTAEWSVFEGETLTTPDDKNGMYYLHVRAEDISGNVSYAVSKGCLLDTAGPQITINPNGNAGCEGEPAYEILVQVTDEISIREKIAVSYAFAATTDTKELTWENLDVDGIVNLSNGTEVVYLHVKAVDELGNETMFCSEQFVPDITAPSGNICVTSALYTNQLAAVLQMEAEDDFAESDSLKMQLMIDGKELEWKDYTKEERVTFEPVEGEHTFAVRFLDKCGNESSWFKTEANVIFDITPPEIAFEYTTTEPTNQNVTVTAILPNMDGELQDTESHVFTENGTFTFTAKDAAGNVSVKVAEVTWIDKKAPEVLLASSQANQRPHKEAEITVTALDEQNTVEQIYYRYYLNGEDAGEWKAYENEGPLLLSGMDGTYIVEAYAVDIIGNASEAVNVKVLLDNTAPKADITYTPSTRTAQNVTAQITFDETEVAVTNVENNKNSIVFEENGEFTFVFQDAAGNIGEAIASVTWIDRSMPTAHTVLKNLDGEVLTEDGWYNQSLKVTIVPQANAYVKDITFNGETIENSSGILPDEVLKDTYLVEEYGLLQYVIKDSETEVESEGSILIKIDKEAPFCEDTDVSFSETGWTNQDVTVVIHAKDTMSRVTYLSGDSYTFTENGTYTFQFVDEAGNIGEKTVNVENIDKVKPVATISYTTADEAAYQPTNWTNQSVQAVISFEDVSQVSILSNDGKNSYWFEANGSMIFTYKDEAGNIGETIVTLDKIDKIAPTGYITKDSYGWTNQDVTATLHASDNLSGADDMVYVFKENGSYVFVLKDKAGNQTEISCIEDRIDKTAPSLTIRYSTEEKTPFSVYATVTANEAVTWTEQKNSHKFEANGTYTFTAVDRAGNMTKTDAEVTWIDKNLPEVEIIYSVTDATNQDVYAEIRPKNTEDIIYVRNNGQQNHYCFTENGEFTFEYTDRVGKETSAVTAQVSWIDKAEPVFTVTYSTEELTKEEVVVHIQSDKEVIWPNGVVREDDRSAFYTVKENGNMVFRASDTLGNTGSIALEVTNIDTKAPVIEMDKSVESIPIGGIFEPLKGILVSDEHLTEERLKVTNPVDVNIAGEYQVVYTAEDAVGNRTECIKTVMVYDPNQFQVILNGQLTGTDVVVLENRQMKLETIHQEGALFVKVLPGKAKIGRFKVEGTDISNELATEQKYEFLETGYYTIFVQDAERNTKCVTVYVNE